MIVNSAERPPVDMDGDLHWVDADRLACEFDVPRSVNLILLGFALNRDRRYLFCDVEDIKTVLSNRLEANQSLLTSAMKALEAGYRAVPECKALIER